MRKEVRLSHKHTRPQRETQTKKKTNTGSFFLSLFFSLREYRTHTGESTVHSMKNEKEGGPLSSLLHNTHQQQQQQHQRRANLMMGWAVTAGDLSHLT